MNPFIREEDKKEMKNPLIMEALDIGVDIEPKKPQEMPETENKSVSQKNSLLMQLMADAPKRKQVEWSDLIVPAASTAVGALTGYTGEGASAGMTGLKGVKQQIDDDNEYDLGMAKYKASLASSLEKQPDPKTEYLKTINNGKPGFTAVQGTKEFPLIAQRGEDKKIGSSNPNPKNFLVDGKPAVLTGEEALQMRDSGRKVEPWEPAVGYMNQEGQAGVRRGERDRGTIGSSRSVTPRQGKEFAALQDDIKQDPAFKSSDEALRATKNIKSLLATNNPIGDQAVAILMPRMLGEVGNLAQSEQQAYGGSRALESRVGQAFQQWSTGNLTPENRKFLTDLADVFEKKALINKDAVIQKWNKAGQASTGLPEEKVKAVTETLATPVKVKVLIGGKTYMTTPENAKQKGYQVIK